MNKNISMHKLFFVLVLIFSMFTLSQSAFADESEKVCEIIPPLDIKDLQKFSPNISKDVFKIISPENSVNSRSGLGETSSSSIKKQTSDIFKRLRRFGYKWCLLDLIF